MNQQKQIIDRIVALVVQRLSAADAAQSQVTVPQSHGGPDGNGPDGNGPDGNGPDGNGVLVADAVITEHTLLSTTRPGAAITVGPRSILTPSARDYLRNRNIRWSRTPDGAQAQAAQSRLLVISGDLDAAGVDRTLVADSLPLPCETRSEPTDSQAVQAAVAHAGSADRNLAVVACGCAARVACLANRDARVRAAAVASTPDARRLSLTWAPNVLCVESRAKSSFELRHLIRSILNLPVSSPGPGTDPDCQSGLEN